MTSCHRILHTWLRSLEDEEAKEAEGGNGMERRSRKHENEKGIAYHLTAENRFARSDCENHANLGTTNLHPRLALPVLLPLTIRNPSKEARRSTFSSSGST
eukprot:747120-Hanusia_phi.AAC.1